MTFEKEAFQPDEVVAIKAQVDNTQCTKDLSKITMKLIRHIESKDLKFCFDNEDTLFCKDFPGVEAGKSEWVNISFSLNEISKDAAK